MTRSWRELLLRTIIWFELTTFSGMVTAETVYNLALWTNSTELASLAQSTTFFLVDILVSFFLLFSITILIARLVLHAKYSKKPVAPELMQRLERLGPEALKRMNITSQIQFAIARRLSIAYLRKNRMIVGEQLLKEATDEEMIGIIGHEAGHMLRKNQTTKKISTLIPFIAFVVTFALAGNSDSGFALAITIAAAITLAKIPFNWRHEYRADLTAANRLGTDTMIATLDQLKKTHFDGISFSHPPLSKRIRRLQLLQPALTVTASV